MEGINLALLPQLDVVKQVDYEAIALDIAKKAGIENLSPSDPAYRIALAGAYREALLRHDANEQAKGLTLAYAKGAQLDHLGVTYYRHFDGSPVVRLTGESDDVYRARLQLANEGLSVAGPEGAYVFHAKSASSQVKDVAVHSPAPVEVDIYVLAYDSSGIPSDDLLNLIAAYLNPRRPLTDLVRVHPAKVVYYDLMAKLMIKPGPDPELVMQAAEKSALAYIELKRRLGGRVVESGLHAALTVEGVEEVHLTDWQDVICGFDESPYCQGFSLTLTEFI